jgi:glycosyltransferase involved in cell wall biosynthesis
MSKKIKIFLGGFINLTNAQNLNCLSIARHLNKDKFEVYTLELYSGNLDSQIGKIPGVQIFNCFKPFRISGYFGFLWGIWNCDVAYLPKHEFWKFNRFLLKLFNKKSFSTVEGILDEDNLASSLKVMKSYDELLKSKAYFTKLFSITNFLGKYNDEHHQIVSETYPLYLGCETKIFSNPKEDFTKLKTIIYIGRLKKQKGIFDFLEIAKEFPNLNFLIFGNGEEQNSK